MARAIDGEAAYRFLSEQLVKETGAFSKGVNKGLNIARSAMRNPDAIPTLTPPNEPLTLEELDGWNTKPAYLVPLGDPIWAAQWSIMRYGRFSVETNAGPMMSICLSKSEYGKTWLAYRRPPEEADA